MGSFLWLIASLLVPKLQQSKSSMLLIMTVLDSGGNYSTQLIVDIISILNCDFHRFVCTWIHDCIIIIIKIMISK